MKTASHDRISRAGRTAYGLLLGTFALLCGAAAAQDSEDETPDSSTEEADEVIVVTGTRLQGGDATARVDVITSEDIKAQGLTTFEDVMRSIPQNFATINSANNLTFDPNSLDTNLGSLGLGAATANLRGFGSKKTLVLLNGKRLAGINSSADQLAANLNDIPAAAIDRVEVSHDGGSAVYGSDGVAGVINVITKRDYTGVTVGTKAEHSSTGGHGRSAYVYVGRGWDTGNVTAHVSLDLADPVKAAKTGWVTNDYSAAYDGDQRYNFVGTNNPRSGLVGLSQWATGSLILPPGNDGRNAQPGDFVAVQPSDYIDVIPEDISVNRDTRQLTASAHQRLGAREQLELRADILYSETDVAAAVTVTGFSPIRVPASNAFNNFGHDVWVAYYPDTEVELGLVPQVEQQSVAEQIRYVLTGSYAFNERFRVEVDYLKSESTSQADQFMFAPPSTRVDDAARLERLNGLIASSDPSVALNLFGDGTGQNPTIAEFYRSFANARNVSHTQTIEPKLYGNLWELPGGPIDFIIGTEMRESWVERPSEDPAERGSLQDFIGTSRPTQNLTAYFLEASVPIVGEANARPFLRRLVLSTQARYDEYRVDGSVEKDANDKPILVETKYTNTVTRIAAAWSPADSMTVRISRSEAFTTPAVSDLFGGTNLQFSDFPAFDPLSDPPWVPAIQSYGPNPELSPESSTNWTFGMDWKPQAVEGLRLKAYWSTIDLENRIARSHELSNLLPVDVYGNLPQFFRRDETGKLLELIGRPINISRRVDERVDLEVEYSIETSFGTVRPRLAYFRILDRFDEAIPGSGKFTHIGKSVSFGNKYDIRANVSLLAGPLTADLWIRHTPGYINNDHQSSFRPLPNEPVGSHTTTDLTVAYELNSGWTFRAGGRNILDRDFPYMLSRNRAPYDRTRIQTRKRVLFLDVSYSLEYFGW